MREIRIYQAGAYQSGETIELSPEAGQHVGVVLRMQLGDSLTLFDGNNHQVEARITAIKKKQVLVLLGEPKEISKESSLSIHLAQGISKGDRMEWVMQKATELGVGAITPLITERCAVKLDTDRLQKKVSQWQAIAVAACEQSGRNSIPTVHFPISLGQFLKQNQAELSLILDPRGQKSWREYTPLPLDIALLVGPEGGFSEDELTLALKQNIQPLSLGPRILRTETAAISALSVLQALGGDL